jgi:hypothetical protein
MSLFDAKMVDKMLATASRNDQSSAVKSNGTLPWSRQKSPLTHQKI